jgi:hypothetical protein
MKVEPMPTRDSPDGEAVAKLLQKMAGDELVSVAVVGFTADNRIHVGTYATTRDIVVLAAALRVFGDRKVVEAMG